MLPPGWVERHSKTHNHVYYIHVESNVASWVHPATMCATETAMAPALPTVPVLPTVSIVMPMATVPPVRTIAVLANDTVERVTTVSGKQTKSVANVATLPANTIKKAGIAKIPKMFQAGKMTKMPLLDKIVKIATAAKKNLTANTANMASGSNSKSCRKSKMTVTTTTTSTATMPEIKVKQGDTDMMEVDADQAVEAVKTNNAGKVGKNGNGDKKKAKRTVRPKIAKAQDCIVSAEIVAKDISLRPFEGAVMHDLGGGCAVLTFHDHPIEMLLPAAVEYVSRDGVLEYDRTFTMFKTKLCTRRRGEGFFSDDKVPFYAFSKDRVVAQPLHPTLRALLDQVNLFVPNDPFYGVFVNCYRPNEKDGIGMHSDKDVQDMENIGVVAISYGAQRILTFRPVDRKNTALKELNLTTKHGQTLIMYGPKFQRMFSHGIAACKGNTEHDSAHSTVADCQGRYSFTFRRHTKAAKKLH